MGKVNLLVVLDGFGYRTETEDNAIAAAHTPNWDRLWAERPHTLISGSGADVGLPPGQMGNSEVGHMTLGAGRLVFQDLTRINRAIAEGEFQRNRTLNRCFDRLKKNGHALHIMGLLSPGGVHSHEQQIFAALQLAAAKGLQSVYLHAFLDGRDTPPRSATASIEAANQVCTSTGARLVSLCGRYYAMDRDQRWDRQEQAYNLIVRGEAPFHASDGREGLELAYSRDESDEFVQPTAIHSSGELPTRIKDGDSVLFMNFRADRARQLSRALVNKDFTGFKRRSTVALTDFITLTRYADDISSTCAFEPMVLTNTLGEYLAKLDKTQLRIAETEKYAHVTYFFSGGQDQPFPGEDREMVPSPQVATYDLQPEMSAREVTEKLIAAIESGAYDAIICNFANGDMVGHTGNFQAAVAAVETLDHCLARLTLTVSATGGNMLITSDHGNVEQMRDKRTGQAHTAHTSELVPLVYVGAENLKLASAGSLADVAPTLLTLMDLEIPKEMTGVSLITSRERRRA